MNTTCLACPQPRAPRAYLCPGCWWTLQPATRRALNRRDDRAGVRLLELRRQLTDGVRLADVTVTP